MLTTPRRSTALLATCVLALGALTACEDDGSVDDDVEEDLDDVGNDLEEDLDDVGNDIEDGVDEMDDEMDDEEIDGDGG